MAATTALAAAPVSPAPPSPVTPAAKPASRPASVLKHRLKSAGRPKAYRSPCVRLQGFRARLCRSLFESEAD